MIQAIEIKKYGVKYKSGKQWFVLFFIAAGLFGYLQDFA